MLGGFLGIGVGLGPVLHDTEHAAGLQDVLRHGVFESIDGSDPVFRPVVFLDHDDLFAIAKRLRGKLEP